MHKNLKMAEGRLQVNFLSPAVVRSSLMINALSNTSQTTWLKHKAGQGHFFFSQKA